ncbi:hypothetical protein ACHQM5_013813 [Ranunculus cassubicifolius]
MSDSDQPAPQTRSLGGTEYSWCRAIPSGTGITVLSLLLCKPFPPHTLQTIVQKLQLTHPILRSKLTYSTPISFTISPDPYTQINSLTTSQSFHQIIEHELSLNQNWPNPVNSDDQTELFYCTHYSIEQGNKWVLVFRVHTSICDRTSGVSLLRELLSLIRGNGGEEGVDDKVNLGIEEIIPSGKASKPFWARGVDLLGYSLNSFRFSNLEFKDVESTRSSGMVRLRLDKDQTDAVLAGCKARGIKLCGAMSAAAIIAAYSSKHLPENQWEKYAVVTLVDCRKELDPPLQSHNFGFYHSAVLNTHDISGETELWELASRCYTGFKIATNSNKHFSDMNDLNFLMGKAIDNPGLTPSASSRTSFVAVFEDPVIDDDTSNLQQEIGLEDFVGCSSVHGIGPSIAVFDTIRNGGLDCSCVYPTPLHSREQMQGLVDEIKGILLNGIS